MKQVRRAQQGSALQAACSIRNSNTSPCVIRLSAIRVDERDQVWKRKFHPSTHNLSNALWHSYGAPRSHWKNKENLMEALNRAEISLGITKPEDWFSVNITDLAEVEQFPSKLSRVKLAELLSEKYPSIKWDSFNILRGKYSQQKKFERAIAALFKGVEIKINARKEAQLIDPENGGYMELDIYIPSLHLAFEYQERHHYITSDLVHTPLDVIVKRDQQKQEAAKAKGLTLIAVPCWWDGSKESLIATIRKARPDLLTEMDTTAQPIPEEMPEKFFDKQMPHIEDIGQPSNASFLTLSSMDPTNWWMFEKYDGLRGFWNPIKKAFYSRSGNKFDLPEDIVNSMPQDTFLDGELWFGRNNFQEAMKISARADASKIDWTKFKYMVFDIPNYKGSYEQRYSALVKLLEGRTGKYIDIAKKETCKDTHHLEVFFQDIIDKGGEGIILRDPNAQYEVGRAPGFLKHKKYRDGEAKVIGPASLLQWECELPNGIRFTAPAGTTEFVRRWNPQPGDIVSFKHRGYLLSTNKPKLPTLTRIRTDMTWEDVVNNWKEQKHNNSGVPRLRPQYPHHPKGYWRKLENRKKFFLEFAKEQGFDPSIPDNWKKVAVRKIKTTKGGRTLLQKYKSMNNVLAHTFPELGFTESVSKESEKQRRRPRDYWRDIENRKAFFLELAKKLAINPQDPLEWNKVTQAHIIANKGHTILRLYDSVQSALIDTFPNLSFPSTARSKKKVYGQKGVSKWPPVYYSASASSSLELEK